VRIASSGDANRHTRPFPPRQRATERFSPHPRVVVAGKGFAGRKTAPVAIYGDGGRGAGDAAAGALLVEPSQHPRAPGLVRRAGRPWREGRGAWVHSPSARRTSWDSARTRGVGVSRRRVTRGTQPGRSREAVFAETQRRRHPKIQRSAALLVFTAKDVGSPANTSRAARNDVPHPAGFEYGFDQRLATIVKSYLVS